MLQMVCCIMGEESCLKTKDECRALFGEFHSIPLGGHSGYLKLAMPCVPGIIGQGLLSTLRNGWVII